MLIGESSGRSVDLVVPVDATSSSWLALDAYKQKIKDALRILEPGLPQFYARITSLRVKVIGYRDSLADPEPMLISPFFRIPEETPALFDFLDAIEPKGGGETPQENALEALVLAMRSDWTNERLSRQIILLFADADPLLPEECGVRPEGMHRSVAELYRWWNTGLPEAGSSFDPRKARLIIAMNDADQSHSRFTTWEDFPQNCHNCVYVPIKSQKDWANVDEVLDLAVR